MGQAIDPFSNELTNASLPLSECPEDSERHKKEGPFVLKVFPPSYYYIALLVVTTILYFEHQDHPFSALPLPIGLKVPPSPCS